ncbi:MAG: hypothetical protein LBB85_05680 [Dysgonamonadaceae bacterium]|nr:hypothetical protein [Dysgonamonadaceae bacterium]
MKKTIFIFFLWLANITLLAHAAIPHHHHLSEPTAMCTAQHEHPDATHPDGETKGNVSFEACLISHIYTKADNNKPDIQSPDARFQPAICLLFLCPDCSIDQISVSSRRRFLPKPYLPFSSTEFIAQSAGLRAPPVC